MSPPNIKIIKSISIRWEGQVAYIGKMRNAYKIYSGKSENHLRNLTADIRTGDGFNELIMDYTGWLLPCSQQLMQMNPVNALPPSWSILLSAHLCPCLRSCLFPIRVPDQHFAHISNFPTHATCCVQLIPLGHHNHSSTYSINYEATCNFFPSSCYFSSLRAKYSGQFTCAHRWLCAVSNIPPKHKNTHEHAYTCVCACVCVDTRGNEPFQSLILNFFQF
jgi:hypothetical protein